VNPASRNLENLKKRAKGILRQHASRYFPVAERIRRALPAFAGLDDREVLDAPFSLTQARQVVAHELGFVEWTHLKRGIETMSTSKTAAERPQATSRPELVRAQPQIQVTDMARAVAFYRDRLGFSVAYLYGEPPYYGLVVRDGVGLNLRHVDTLAFDPATCHRETILAATIVVRQAKALFLAYKEAGLEFHQAYREQPWNAHDFVVADPDGNLIHFATPPGED
jgi:catechol 2,3-dioxygenase-like lactoylglutathione lyase family enzyme